MENSISNKRKHDEHDGDDLINHHHPTTAMKKSKTTKNVRFDDVTVYYFPRSQGFVSVPSQGTVTLGSFVFVVILSLYRSRLFSN